jgi:hypothetical protein
LEQLRADYSRKTYESHFDSKTQPLKLQLLNDFGARVSKVYFVFNINEDLIKEQNFYWRDSFSEKSLDILINQDQPEIAKQE